MRRTLRIPTLLLAAVAALSACQDQQIVAPELQPASSQILQVPEEACGTPMTVPMRTPGGQVVAHVTVYNTEDPNTLYLMFETEPGYTLLQWAGAWMPLGAPAMTDPAQFPFGGTLPPGVSRHIEGVRIQVEPGEEVMVAIWARFLHPSGRVTVHAWADGQPVNRGQARYFIYTWQACEDDDVPAPGTDVVVFNDVNPFDDNAMGVAATDNPTMVRNLVSFTTDGPRNDGNVVWWDFGRNSACPNCVPLSTTRSIIASEGFTLTDISSSSGTLVSIPADVKSIWLWLPRVYYTDAEINALKQFASEGGRIVFIGEHSGFYGDGIPIQNDFLARMGAVLRNTGGAVDCGYTTLTSASIRPHQVTQGVNSLTIACASVIEPGGNDYVLFYDTSVTHVLAGVATIDTEPLGAGLQMQRAAPAMRPIDPNLNPRSTTGH
jgi:hypothetical protein